MSRLPAAGEHAIRDLISRYNLHTSRLALPVPIRLIARAEGWRVWYREGLWPLYAFAVVDGPIRLMVVNACLSDEYQRWAIAHEMAHALNGDGSLHPHLCAANGPLAPWTTRRMEQQADQFAARLLIPDWIIDETGGDIAEIAAACEVPPRLVELRLAGLNKRRGHGRE